ncbi:hypothetical protein WL05_16685 [Burkholderia ubonensis]|uniref:hypothetical protein n=1 Tax=Burkholderia ubonensis TaxID=101571 RepID=UPI00075EF225|nr:hypothetical protein [Burkholderia ubonensis]KVM18058.1 hypothetical protein WJ51_08715 [Burkholderia ubonensis]KVM18678.1 hypothetical protein WJ52_10665 [Burkholderia ubonensis]KVM48642.1 hypothetical protein WJ56_18875 [Burkholderia ubonensis]KVX47175.1 hypothetical protein WL05_16685 [Burkholderia ubonensis]KVX96180.1 hypothetical protein WL10_04570 [Burkholderia ubonensis]
MQFYTLTKAAAAIAAELYPTDANDGSNDLRADAERCYLTALRDAVYENEIVYRDPGSRLPIRQDGIAAFMTAQWCVVSVADLNTWLDRAGVGVQLPTASSDSVALSHESDEPDMPSDEWPTSAELASTLGPLLERDHDADWLKGRLGDAARYRQLEKYRRKEGGRSTARWEVSGVVMYLIDLNVLTWEKAKTLQKQYPQLATVLEGLGKHLKTTATNWFPPSVG